MPYLIGTDEAGYGPNLGPLIVSATVWEVPGGVRNEDLGGRLEGVIVPTAAEVDRNGEACMAMADSKALYKAGGGLRHLERGLFTSLATLRRHPRSWQELWSGLAPQSAHVRSSIPWYAGYQVPLPLDVDPDKISALAHALQQTFSRQRVRLLEIRSRAIFPQEFNRGVQRLGSKGTLLSHVTLALVADRITALTEKGEISVVCDKHGGRNRYRDLLAEHFRDRLIEIHGECRQRSVYRFGRRGQRVEIRFQAKAESCLPVALASMASKYLRELAMRALNSYWCDRIQGLKPTAGYPQDAKRFKAAIDGIRTELGIEERTLWRTR